MTELYEWPPTRSQRAKWVLEELEPPYSGHLVNMIEQEQDSPEYRSIHPLGVVPALRTDGYTMFESVAIVLQLIDEHPEKNMTPAPGSPERAAYYQWSIFLSVEYFRLRRDRRGDHDLFRQRVASAGLHAAARPTA